MIGKVTKCQRRVLRAWVHYGNMKEAAHALGLSIKTIEYHLAKVRERLRINQPLWVALWAVRHRVATVPTKAK